MRRRKKSILLPNQIKSHIVLYYRRCERVCVCVYLCPPRCRAYPHPFHSFLVQFACQPWAVYNSICILNVWYCWCKGLSSSLCFARPWYAVHTQKIHTGTLQCIALTASAVVVADQSDRPDHSLIFVPHMSACEKMSSEKWLSGLNSYRWIWSEKKKKHTHTNTKA